MYNSNFGKVVSSTYIPQQTQHISRTITSPRHIIVQQETQNSERDDINTQSYDHLSSLKKLYFMMLLYFIFTIALIYSEWLNSYFSGKAYYLIIFFSLCILFSLLALWVQNYILYILFTIVFCFLGISIAGYIGSITTLMIYLMFGGQILAQFINCLQFNQIQQAKQNINQYALYSITAGLIVFQLFFNQGLKINIMIIILTLGVFFGFLLVFATQTNKAIFQGDPISFSISIYCNIISQLFGLSQKIINLYQKDKYEIEIQLVNRNERVKNNFRVMKINDCKKYKNSLLNQIGNNQMIGLSDGMAIIKERKIEFYNQQIEECTKMAIIYQEDDNKS